MQRRPPAVFQMRLIWAHRGLVWTQFISDVGRVGQWDVDNKSWVIFRVGAYVWAFLHRIDPRLERVITGIAPTDESPERHRMVGIMNMRPIWRSFQQGDHHI